MKYLILFLLLFVPTSAFAQAPVISNLTSTPIGGSVQIKWTTDVSATQRVFYDTVSHPTDTDGTQYAFSSSNDTNPDTTKQIRIITYLPPSTTYFYKVRSANGSGATFSSEQTFTTAANGVRTSNLLIIRLNFPNDLASLPSDTTINTVMTNIKGFLESYSFGQSTINWTIVPGTLTAPNDTNFYKNIENTISATRRAQQLAEDASALALSAGFNTNDYFQYVIWIPQFYDWANSGFFSAVNGLSQMHINIFQAEYVILANLLTFGLGSEGRANGWVSNDSTVFGTAGFPHASGIADSFDMLGGESVQNNLNLKHKIGAAWLLPSDIHTVTANGTYRIYAHDTETTKNASRKYGIRMAGYQGKEYFIEFRQNTPINGLLINWGGFLILDMVPATSGDFTDAQLTVGNTFTDPDSRSINFTVTAGSPSFADVTISGLSSSGVKTCNWHTSPACN